MGIIAQNNGLLPKEFNLHGFTIDVDDHVQTVKRNGRVSKTIDGKDMRYTWHTDPVDIYKDIASIIETEKAVSIEVS